MTSVSLTRCFNSWHWHAVSSTTPRTTDLCSNDHWHQSRGGDSSPSKNMKWGILISMSAQVFAGYMHLCICYCSIMPQLAVHPSLSVLITLNWGLCYHSGNESRPTAGNDDIIRHWRSNPWNFAMDQRYLRQSNGRERCATCPLCTRTLHASTAHPGWVFRRTFCDCGAR